MVDLGLYVGGGGELGERRGEGMDGWMCGFGDVWMCGCVEANYWDSRERGKEGKEGPQS